VIERRARLWSLCNHLVVDNSTERPGRGALPAAEDENEGTSEPFRFRVPGSAFGGFPVPGSAFAGFRVRRAELTGTGTG
jgi:hypothetical protein